MHTAENTLPFNILASSLSKEDEMLGKLISNSKVTLSFERKSLAASAEMVMTFSYQNRQMSLSFPSA